MLNLTQNVRKMLSQMDEDLVLACQHKLEEEDSRSKDTAERRKITWERLEAAAATNGQCIGSNGNGSGNGGDIIVPMKPAAAACSVACC